MSLKDDNFWFGSPKFLLMLIRAPLPLPLPLRPPRLSSEYGYSCVFFSTAELLIAVVIKKKKEKERKRKEKKKTAGAIHRLVSRVVSCRVVSRPAEYIMFENSTVFAFSVFHARHRGAIEGATLRLLSATRHHWTPRAGASREQLTRQTPLQF